MERRARYRGRWKVLCGQLLAATAANVKRIVCLLCAEVGERGSVKAPPGQKVRKRGKQGSFTDVRSIETITKIP